MDDVTTEARPVTLVGFTAAGTGPSAMDGVSAGGGVGLHVVVHTPGPWGFSVGGREGYFGNDRRTVGCVLASGRFDPDGPLHVRGGFAHHHETELSMALDRPVETALGTLVGIRHRTGLDLGAGVSLPIGIEALDDRLDVVAELSLAVFADPHGPPVYAFLDVGVGLHVGKPR